MRKLALIVAVVCVFMAAGCVSGQVNSDGTMSSSAFGTSLGELANVRDKTVRTTVYERNADKDAEAEREMRRNRAAAEDEVIRGQAQILQAYAERLSPATGLRLKELLARQERLFAAWEAETGNTDEGLELKLSLWDEIQETRQLISDFLNQQGAPAGYVGGMGGLPLMGPGVSMMPGMGSPIVMGGGILPQGIRRDDPGLGVVDNQTENLVFHVTLDGTQQFVVEPRTVSAPVYLQPERNHRIRIEAFARTGGGLVPQRRVFERNIPVDSSREPDYGYGWAAWAMESDFR